MNPEKRACPPMRFRPGGRRGQSPGCPDSPDVAKGKSGKGLCVDPQDAAGGHAGGLGQGGLEQNGAGFIPAQVNVEDGESVNQKKPGDGKGQEGKEIQYFPASDLIVFLLDSGSPISACRP